MPKNPSINLAKVLLTYPKCPEDKETLLTFLKSLEGYECSVICQEHHEDGELHLHAFVKFSKTRKIRHNTAMSLFKFKDYNADVEFLKTSKDIAKAVKYCMKEDPNPLSDNCDPKAISKEWHVRKYNTKVMLETPIDKLVEEDAVSPYALRNIVWAQQWWKLHTKAADAPSTRGIWVYGPPGCGKSTWAKDFGSAMGGFYEKAQNKWFDGYDGEPVIILEDLDTNTLNHYLKIWADKWACKGEVKGGTIWLSHKYFVVTSNYGISELANRGQPDEALEAALARRFTLMELPSGRQFFEWPTDDPTTPPDPKQAPTPARRAQVAEDNPSAGFTGSGYQ